VADESNNAVHAIKNTGGVYTVTQNIISHVNTEASTLSEPSVHLTPAGCQQGQGNGASSWRNNRCSNSSEISAARLHSAPNGGNVILTSESGADFADTSSHKSQGGNYVQSSSAPESAPHKRGRSMVTATFRRLHRLLHLLRHYAYSYSTATATATAHLLQPLRQPLRNSYVSPTPTPTPTPTATPPSLICQTAYSSAICNLGSFGKFAVLVLDSMLALHETSRVRTTLIQGDIGLCGGTSGAIRS